MDARDSQAVNALERELEELLAGHRRLTAEIAKVFRGHDAVVEQLLLCLYAGGHVLLEGVPGLGKTTLVRALAASLALSFRRIQFTPDLMPGDILGLRLLEEDAAGRKHFTFQRGPVFANVVLADEINRASPRTQSALLEAMAEARVTLFGESQPLDDPFFLVATENPIEMEGTYPLPEAQLDRFLYKVVLGLPTLEETVAVLAATAERPPAVESVVQPTLSRDQVRRLRELTRQTPTSSDMVELAARVVLATQPAGDAPDDVKRYVRHGSSPRGGQALLWTAKARALVRGRLHVGLEDLEAACAPALRHRLILGYEGEAAGVSTDALARAALEHAKARVSWR
jgi:MoxR-like ATPase